MSQFSTRTEFLEIPEVDRFVTYLSELLLGKQSFSHSYQITMRKWQSVAGANWQCGSLSEAKDHYWWHGSYDENSIKLSELERQLKEALSKNDESAILYGVLRIFEWGDVYKGCTGYVLNKYKLGTLGESIREAVILMEGETLSISRFDQLDLRMDSGLTKVYALASEHSIILDSRVAAALTLIAYRLYQPDELKAASELKFLASGKNESKEKKRNVIDGKRVIFPVLKPGKQAHYNLVTNWLLLAAVEKSQSNDSGRLLELWGVNSTSGLLRALEAALFMIGSDITTG